MQFRALGLLRISVATDFLASITCRPACRDLLADSRYQRNNGAEQRYVELISEARHGCAVIGELEDAPLCAPAN